MNALDLTFLSIYRINGQEWPLLPGFVAQNQPKKLARGRDQDRLLVYVTLAGNVSFSNDEYSEIAGYVAETFYNTPGSLTFALKTAASALNTRLVERNMKSTGKGLYNIGALVLCSLRGNSMYIVQAGPTHVYHLGAETKHLYDPQLAGKGLGLSQTARMYFSQITLAAGDRLLMCAALPPNWDKAIVEVRESSGLDNIRRRLLAVAETNISALLVQASDGTGTMNILRAVNDEPAASIKVAAPVLDPVYSQTVSLEKEPEVEIAAGSESVQIPAADIAEVEIVEPLIPNGDEELVPLSTSSEPASRNRHQNKSRQSQPLLPPDLGSKVRGQAGIVVRNSALFLARSIQKMRAWWQKLGTWTEKAIPRLLPEEESQPVSNVSRTWATFFAIAIPILLFVVARVVYYQLGFEAQYQNYFSHARQTAEQASAETAPSVLRVEWQSTLDWLDLADQYQLSPSADSQKLRQDAQSALDGLDKIIRLDFTPAFSDGIGRNLQVSRMSASDSDVYLLDPARGAVLRGAFNGKNYDLDGTFLCGPGTYDAMQFGDIPAGTPLPDKIQVNKLIDIVALPRLKAVSATLLGIDTSGTLLYCSPGELPHAAALQRPEAGWKSITSIVYDAYNLYVLDAPARAVWIYYGTDQVQFGNPTFFFQEQMPVMLEEAIGLAVNGDDLYLLHKDGHLATCTFSHIDVSPTRCNDPAIYIDLRPGYEGGMNLADGVFSQIMFTSAPDPVIAMLEPFTQSIFKFSSRSLELQNQIRAGAGKDNPLPKDMPVTAMTFSPNKILFIFVDGKVFFSKNVP